MTNYHVIFAISSISTFLPFLTSSILVKHVKGYRVLKIFWFFWTVAATTEIIVNIFTLHGKQSALISHIYTVIEYYLIAIILANLQTDSVIAKLMRRSVPIYIFIFVVIKIAGLENFSAGTINYITRPLAILLLSTFAFLTLQNLWSRTPANLTNDYRFWMLLAMALYYSASLILFAFMFTKDLSLLIALFKIHAVINIIHNVLFTIGVLQLRGPKHAELQPTPAS